VGGSRGFATAALLILVALGCIAIAKRLEGERRMIRRIASLKDVNNRRHEPWVLEGLNYIHHPLRADASKKYVAQSLDMLWDIQKTGDIFFPKRWRRAALM